MVVAKNKQSQPMGQIILDVVGQIIPSSEGMLTLAEEKGVDGDTVFLKWESNHCTMEPQPDLIDIMASVYLSLNSLSNSFTCSNPYF